MRGTVTAEAGRLGTASLIAIEDETAGIVVRLQVGTAGPPRDVLVEVEGALAAPYGQLEIRPGPGGLIVDGAGSPPTPLGVVSTELGESVEGDLVAVDVEIDRPAHREANGSLTLDARDPVTGGRIAIRADASAGIATSALPRRARAHLVGVAGQRATRSGRLDGYRIWLRDRADIDLVADPSVGPGSSSPSSPGPGDPPVIRIAQALLSPGVPVRVEGTVTVAGHLLDPDGRTLVIQDASAAIAVRLPSGAAIPRSGGRLRVDGLVGRAYGAPRLAATAALDLGPGAPILPVVIRTLPGPAHEWRLVRISGVVLDVHRTGDRWRAEIADGRAHLLVVGLPASGIPSTAIVEGRPVTIVGIVRRPYPSATDRRFAVEPRSMTDIRLGAAGPAGTTGGGSPGSGGTTGTGGGGAEGGASAGPASSGDIPPFDVDIATLAEHLGATVRVGGIVTAVGDGAILLDDGTAVGRIELAGDAASYLDLLAPGDALDALGRVEATSDGPAVRVLDASGIVRVGDPGTAPEPAAATPDRDASPVAPGAEAPALGSGVPGAAVETGAFGAVVVAVLALTGVLAVGLTLLRRRARAQVLAARVAERLAALSDPVAPPTAGRAGGRS